PRSPGARAPDSAATVAPPPPRVGSWRRTASCRRAKRSATSTPSRPEMPAEVDFSEASPDIVALYSGLPAARLSLPGMDDMQRTWDQLAGMPDRYVGPPARARDELDSLFA